MITAQGRESFNKRSPLLLLNQAGKAYSGTFIKYYKISQLIHTQSIAN
jgi:hypothetical protein